MAESTLAQWRVFVEAARTGSLSTAATQLNLTQSAVSHALRELEERLSLRLFHRHGRGVRLTEEGTTLRPLAEELLAQFAALQDAARGAVAISGTVRVAAFPSLARHLLPEALSLLRQRHPALQIELNDAHFDRASVIGAVQGGAADVGLTQLLPEMGLSAHVLGEDPYLLITPDDWDPSEVWTHPYIHLGDRQDLLVPRALLRFGVQLRPSLSLSSEAAIVALVQRGLGFALLPLMTMPSLPIGVARHSMPWPVTRSYGTVTRSGMPSAAIQAVLDALWVGTHEPDVRATTETEP